METPPPREIDRVSGAGLALRQRIMYIWQVRVMPEKIFYFSTGITHGLDRMSVATDLKAAFAGSNTAAIAAAVTAEIAAAVAAVTAAQLVITNALDARLDALEAAE